jgi:NADH-quinone oxidoreductase subunit L
MSPLFWWSLLLLPIVSAAVSGLFLRRLPPLAMGLSVASAWACFLVAVACVVKGVPAPARFEWLSVAELQFHFGIILDGLSKAMLLVVTGVGALIHLFSLGYMAHDTGRARFFACLSLFMFSMTGIVLSDNLVMTFIFWELVGVSSYLLIGFWFERPSAAAAANKAFIVNRIGDFGFMLGILGIWTLLGSVDFSQLEGVRNDGRAAYLDPVLVTLATLGLFCGAMGKSAQVPLHVWLPDAMEGPTPVSALIHAATMVAAGVYFLCRVFFLLELAPATLMLVANIGAFTAIFAAVIALQQNDIKRILAYSTLSQLGYMIMAVGLGATGAAMFHLTTHAFFKALLFLGAGSVIHAMHHEQDIWKMGGLARRMPVTFGTFLVGTMALVGFPGLSGFFSKDAILITAWEVNRSLFWPALLTAGLTAFYMTRLVVVAFLGEPRHGEGKEVHESPWVMTLPLVVLAVLSVVGGWGGVVLRYLDLPVVHTHPQEVIGMAVGVFLLGTLVAWAIYKGRRAECWHVAAVRNKFYVDELYRVVVIKGNDGLAFLLGVLDRFFVNGLLVRGSCLVVSGMGHFFRITQSGNIQGYAFLFGLGVVGLLWWMLQR